MLNIVIILAPEKRKNGKVRKKSHIFLSPFIPFYLSSFSQAPSFPLLIPLKEKQYKIR
jgi:hypothetical protein